MDGKSEFVPIGDLGLFYTIVDGEVDYTVGEVSMMIAVKEHRSRGIGKKAFLKMTDWASRTLATKKIVAKVKRDNVGSLQFFKHSLEFVEEGFAECFDEWTLVLDLSSHTS